MRIFSEKYDELKTHSTSALCKGEPGNFRTDPDIFTAGAEWLIHGEKSSASKMTFIRNITLVPSIDVILFAGNINLANQPAANQHDDTVFKIDEWIQCIVDVTEAELLFLLRSKFASVMSRFLLNHRYFMLTCDEVRVLDTLINVVQQEDMVERNIKFNRAMALNDNQ